LIASPRTKRILKEAQRQVKEQEKLPKIDYKGLVDSFEDSDLSEVAITDFKKTPSAVRKGINRAIKTRGYKMEAHVYKGEVVVKK
jgi:hypothetical protein